MRSQSADLSEAREPRNPSPGSACGLADLSPLPRGEVRGHINMQVASSPRTRIARKISRWGIPAPYFTTRSSPLRESASQPVGVTRTVWPVVMARFLGASKMMMWMKKTIPGPMTSGLSR